LVGNWQGTEDELMYYDFNDMNGASWSIMVQELREPDLQLLKSGESVRLLGTTTNLSKRHFHACGVFPWLFSKDVGAADMAAQRQVFVHRMYDHMETGDRLKALEAEVYPNRPLKGKPFMEGLCAEIAAVKRVKFTQ